MELKNLYEKDFPMMAAFYKDVFSREPWKDDWSDEKQLAAYIKDIAGCFNSINYGLYEGEKMLGLCLGSKRHWWGGTEYVIEEFCISPDMQGKGVGTKFMQMITDKIKTDDMNGIYLCTERDKPAYDFYKKKGFTELTSHISFYKDL